MKIKTKEFIKTLEGKDTELTIGEALSNILLGTKEGGKMKMFVLAKNCYENKEVELDEADLSLVRKAIEGSESYTNLVTGQLLLMLESGKEKSK